MSTLTFSHPGFSGHIGVARRDITPPVGIHNRNWGAATSDVATGIHRPLTLTALALKQNAGDPQPLVLISADLGWWRTDEDEREVRGAVLDALGVDEARVLFQVNHTHSGPSICRTDADKPGGHLIGPYIDRLKAETVSAAREAVQIAAPGVLDWAYGKCTVARNRDLPDPSAERVVCGFNPGLPADDTLLIGRATDARGKVIATLINYAMHPVTLAWQNTLISPDFVGALHETVEAHTGGAPSLFLQGASGELAPMDEYTGDTAVADRNGRALAFASLAVLEGMLPPGQRLDYAGAVESGAPLATWAKHPATYSNHLDARMQPIEHPLRDTLPSLAEIEARLATATEPYMIERLRRRRHLRRAMGDGPTSRQHVWLWRAGDAMIVANPNEAYSNLQVELRRHFPGLAMAVLNLTNGGYAYLPPTQMYGLDQYQVWQTPYERGCLERMIATCVQAVEQMTR